MTRAKAGMDRIMNNATWCYNEPNLYRCLGFINGQEHSFADADDSRVPRPECTWSELEDTFKSKAPTNSPDNARGFKNACEMMKSCIFHYYGGDDNALEPKPVGFVPGSQVNCPENTLPTEWTTSWANKLQHCESGIRGYSEGAQSLWLPTLGNLRTKCMENKYGADIIESYSAYSDKRAKYKLACSAVRGGSRFDNDESLRQICPGAQSDPTQKLIELERACKKPSAPQRSLEISVPLRSF